MNAIIRIFLLCCALQCLFAPAQVSCGRSIFARDETHAMNGSVTSCIATVVRHCFRRGSIVCVGTSGYMMGTNDKVHYSTFEMVMADVMSGVGHSVMFKRASTVRSTSTFAGFEKVHNYLLFVESAEDCKVTINMLMASASWNPHGNFLVFLVGIKTNWASIVTEIFEFVWKYFVINLTILVSAESGNYSRIITWMPFDAGNCGGETLKFIQVGVCRDRAILPSPEHFFPIKVSD